VALEEAGEVPDTRQPSEIEVVVQEALGKLREPERLALTLHYINGYSHGEIGEFLGVRPETVKTRLARARQHLREEVMSMVKDTFEGRKLPEEFTHGVLQKLSLSPIEEGGISLSFNESVRAFIMGVGQRGQETALIALAMKPEDSYAIEDLLSGSENPQPKTRAIQTMRQVMEDFGIQLQRVALFLDANKQCRARAAFRQGKRERILDLRASDALALAVATRASLFLDDAVVQQGKVGEDALQPPFEENVDALRVELQGCAQGNRLQAKAFEIGLEPQGSRNIVRLRKDEAAGALELLVPGTDQPPVQLDLSEYSLIVERLWDIARSHRRSSHYRGGMEFAIDYSLAGDAVEERYTVVGTKELPRTNRIG